MTSVLCDLDRLDADALEQLQKSQVVGFALHLLPLLLGLLARLGLPLGIALFSFLVCFEQTVAWSAFASKCNGHGSAYALYSAASMSKPFCSTSSGILPLSTSFKNPATASSCVSWLPSSACLRAGVVEKGRAACVICMREHYT